MLDQLSLREEAILRYQEYCALRLLLNAASTDERLAMEETLRQLESVPRRDLKRLDAEVRQQVRALRREFGVVATRADLQFLIDPKATGLGDALYVSKHALDGLVHHYERRLDIYPKLPPHARIRVCVFNPAKPAPGIEVFVLEASLFEDMAALWNSAIEASAQPAPEGAAAPAPDGISHKSYNALLRATAKAGFNLIEGYLNGLAFDILVATQVSPEDETKLREWDATRSRPSPMTLRDKILQYPKIALGVAHPPLTEGNCPAMRRVVELQDTLRHSLIHPTPQARGVPYPQPTREESYWNIRQSQVSELCDSAIALIRALDNVLGSRFGTTDYWLHDRTPEGRFPDTTFS